MNHTKSKWFFRDYIIAVLSEFREQKAHRSKVISGVYEMRKRYNDTLPRTFEQTVQQCFERHCGESDVFCGKPELNLFCWPEGKGSGIWGLVLGAVERYQR